MSVFVKQPDGNSSHQEKVPPETNCVAVVDPETRAILSISDDRWEPAMIHTYKARPDLFPAISILEEFIGWIARLRARHGNPKVAI